VNIYFIWINRKQNKCIHNIILCSKSLVFIRNNFLGKCIKYIKVWSQKIVQKQSKKWRNEKAKCTFRMNKKIVLNSQCSHKLMLWASHTKNQQATVKKIVDSYLVWKDRKIIYSVNIFRRMNWAHSSCLDVLIDGGCLAALKHGS